MSRKIIEKYDIVTFKPEFRDSDWFKSNRSRFRWAPSNNELFTVLRTMERLNATRDSVELCVGVYSEEKGAWTSVSVPARFIEYIHQRNEEKEIIRSLHITRTFHSNLFKDALWEFWEEIKF